MSERVVNEEDTMQGAYSYSNTVLEIDCLYVKSPDAAQKGLRDYTSVVLVEDPGWAVDIYSFSFDWISNDGNRTL